MIYQLVRILPCPRYELKDVQNAAPGAAAKATTEPNNDALAGSIATLDQRGTEQRAKLALIQQNAANMTAADKQKLQSSHDKVCCTEIY